MTKKYLIALDLDGTLLKDNKKICFRTKKYLQKLQRKGHDVILASGRPYRAIKKYHDELKLTTPLICYNGTFIVDPKDANFPTHVSTFKKEDIYKIIDEVGLENFENIMCETNNDIWLIKDDEEIAGFFWSEGMNIHYGDLRTTLDKDPMTMIMKFKDHSLDKRIKTIVESHHILLRHWNDSDINFAELYYAEENKASAIKYVSDYYHIDFKHTIAFGDAENDIEMLNSCAIGVVMKNAREAMREHGTFISVDTNNKNGIMKTLKKIIK